MCFFFKIPHPIHAIAFQRCTMVYLLSMMGVLYPIVTQAQYNLNTGFVLGYGSFEVENALIDSTFRRTRPMHWAVGFTIGQTYQWRAVRAGLWYAFHTGTAYEIEGREQRGGLRRSHHSFNLSAELLFNRLAIGTELGFGMLRYTLRLPDLETSLTVRTQRYPLVHPFVQYALVHNPSFRLYARLGVLQYRTTKYGEELIRTLGHQSSSWDRTSRVLLFQVVFYNGPSE